MDWAYPQPEHSDAELGTVLVSAMLGRVHLSGRPDLLTGDQMARTKLDWDGDAGALRVGLQVGGSAVLIAFGGRNV
ncbi:hypothetical protein [Streptomyces sp. NPDC054940]